MSTNNSDTTIQTTRREVEALREFVVAYDAMEEAINAATEVPEEAFDEAAATLADARVAVTEAQEAAHPPETHDG